MVTYKHVDKLIAAIMALAVVLSITAMLFADELIVSAGGSGVAMEYESKLFDTDAPLTVNIIMEGSEWEKMLSNAMEEAYYQCDVEVDGQTFYRVGIRPKGNTSLSAIASNPDTDRYSFKLEFDQFVKGQTCYGLEKLALNNNYADATNMKEALIYDMYRYMGADASLYNYAFVYVNGEYWGVYVALEAVEDSFLLRNYGVADGELYKPDSMDMGDKGAGGDMGGAVPVFADGGKPDKGQRDFDGKGGGFGGFSMGGNGANLNYSGDALDSYSAIWDGAVTKAGNADHKRVVKALKNISEGTELEKYMDIDNLLRYMAVHVFSVNSDSLTGTMAHNYYLYEKDGQLNMIPWDYNLSLGGMMGGGNASGTVNDAIDGAFSGTKFFDTLMEDERYYEQYHAYLRQLVDGYINGGGFDAFYTRTRGILDEAVQTDPTAFYTFEEYSDAADTLYEVVKLRGRSIAGQLDGSIPSTESAQRQKGSSLIDTGDLDLSIMGSMNMNGGAMGGGGGFRGFGGGFNFGGGFVGGNSPEGGGNPPEGFEPPQGGGNLPEGFEPPQGGGNLPEGFEPPQGSGNLPEGFEPQQQEGGNLPEGFELPQGGGQNDGATGDAVGEQSSETGRPDRGNTEFGGFPGGGPGGSEGIPGGGPEGTPGRTAGNAAVAKNLITYGVSFAIFAVAFLFVMCFKRRSRRS